MRPERSSPHTAVLRFAFAAKITHSPGNRKQKSHFQVIHSVFLPTDSAVTASAPRLYKKTTACHDKKDGKRYKESGTPGQKKGRAAPKGNIPIQTGTDSHTPGTGNLQERKIPPQENARNQTGTLIEPLDGTTGFSDIYFRISFSQTNSVIRSQNSL